MIITRTPFRISFFGGGTDYPDFYREHGGAVLSTTINKYCYITCRYLPPFFNYKFHVKYSKTEKTQSIEDIKQTSVKACLTYMGIEKGVEIIHTADIPALSGIGSSSSFTVGLLNALHALKGEIATKRQLAHEAIDIEQNLIGENVGSQDQTSAAFGGFNKIEFSGKEDIFTTPMTLHGEKLSRLQECLLFYFTGFTRFSSDIAESQVKNIKNKIRELKTMKEMVDESIKIISGDINGISDFGKLMHESWLLKRGLSADVTSSRIDEIYATALNSGAVGGKICGAGGGGFIIFFVLPEDQPRVKKALQDLLLVPFRFETLGSHVIHYSS